MRIDSGGKNGTAEVMILARVLGGADQKLNPTMARHILGCRFGKTDRDRMHDLVVRNQSDSLNEKEKGELKAYAKASTLLSILKSQARQSLGIKARKQVPS